MFFYFGNFKEIHSRNNHSHYFKRLGGKNDQVQGRQGQTESSIFEKKIVGEKKGSDQDIGDTVNKKPERTKIFEEYTFSRNQSLDKDLTKRNLKKLEKKKVDNGKNKSWNKHFMSHTFKRKHRDINGSHQDIGGEYKKYDRLKVFEDHIFRRDQSLEKKVEKKKMDDNNAVPVIPTGSVEKKIENKKHDDDKYQGRKKILVDNDNQGSDNPDGESKRSKGSVKKTKVGKTTNLDFNDEKKSIPRCNGDDCLESQIILENKIIINYFGQSKSSKYSSTSQPTTAKHSEIESGDTRGKPIAKKTVNEKYIQKPLKQYSNEDGVVSLEQNQCYDDKAKKFVPCDDELVNSIEDDVSLKKKRDSNQESNEDGEISLDKNQCYDDQSKEFFTCDGKSIYSNQSQDDDLVNSIEYEVSFKNTKPLNEDRKVIRK